MLEASMKGSRSAWPRWSGRSRNMPGRSARCLPSPIPPTPANAWTMPNRCTSWRPSTRTASPATAAGSMILNTPTTIWRGLRSISTRPLATNSICATLSMAAAPATPAGSCASAGAVSRRVTGAWPGPSSCSGGGARLAACNVVAGIRCARACSSRWPSSWPPSRRMEHCRPTGTTSPKDSRASRLPTATSGTTARSREARPASVCSPPTAQAATTRPASSSRWSTTSTSRSPIS